MWKYILRYGWLGLLGACHSPLSMDLSSAPQGSLLFTAQAQLYRFDLATQTETRLNTANLPVHFPHSNGQQTVFSTQIGAQHELALLDHPTQQVQRLTHDSAMESFPRLSPDGQWIAYQARQGTDTGVYLMDIQGHHRQRLSPEHLQAFYPQWAPDGKQLLYSVQTSSGSALYRHQVGSPAPELFSPQGNVDDLPRWAPNGQQLAFVSADQGAWNLYTAHRDGSQRNQWTHHEEVLAPQWSPNGQFVAYSVRMAADNASEATRSQIYSLELATGQHTFIAEGHDAWAPQWSPDSQTLIFGLRQDKHLRFYQVSRTGGTPRLLHPQQTDMHLEQVLSD